QAGQHPLCAAGAQPLDLRLHGRRGANCHAGLFAGSCGYRIGPVGSPYPGGDGCGPADRRHSDPNLPLSPDGHSQRRGPWHGDPFLLGVLRQAFAGIRDLPRADRRGKPRCPRTGATAQPGDRAGSGEALSASPVLGLPQPIFWPVFAQSARKASKPLSVSGCLTSAFSVAGGTVATSAPIIATCLTWFTVRTEAARISVLKS